MCAGVLRTGDAKARQAEKSNCEGADVVTSDRGNPTIKVQSNPTLTEVIALLKQHGLPTQDLTPRHLESFLGVGTPGALSGVVGLEFYGADALLRSLAVATPGTGLGTQLLEAAEAFAKSRSVTTAYLLTSTAEKFFARHGYQAIERHAAPKSISSCAEFTSLCPDTAIVMRKAFTTSIALAS